MSDPRLLDPPPLAQDASRVRWATATAGAACAGALLVVLAVHARTPVPTGPLTLSRADLGADLVTPVDSLPAPLAAAARQRLTTQLTHAPAVAQALAAKRLQAGVLAFWDDDDIDGDALLVSAGGVAQAVPLQKGVTPVVTAYAPGGAIRVQALSDGGNVVTASLMTSSGPVMLKRMRQGETIDVAAP